VLLRFHFFALHEAPRLHRRAAWQHRGRDAAFLFLVGVSMALSILPWLEQGASPSALTRVAMWRALRILLLGGADRLGDGSARH